ncbi:MAG TPA: hypothetical protein VI072_33510 [Polyangiaceae bacterium]
MSSRDPYNSRAQFPGPGQYPQPQHPQQAQQPQHPQQAQYPHPQQAQYPHPQQGQPQQAQYPHPQQGQPQQAQYPHPQQGQPQQALQAQRIVPQYDDDVAAIPMKKSNPKVLLAIAGGAVLVLGVAAYSMFGGKKETVPAAAATAAQVSQAEEVAKAKALREHVELTQRSLAKLEEAKPKSAPPPAAEPAEPAPAAEEPRAAAPAKRSSTTAAKAPASRPKVASAPAPKPAKRASPKSLESLDDLGKGIASELGK